MHDFRFFDAFCQVGRHMKLGPGGLHTAADLLGDLDHVGIAEALVVDSLARENHPEEGNARILETVAAHPRLHPAWVVMPHGAPEEQPRGEALLAALRGHRVGALWLLPEQYKFSLSDWCVDEFLEPIAAAGVPVFINYNEVHRGGWGWDQTNWDAVVALCRRMPNLPVIVSEYRIRRAQRAIYRALETCPNLHLELSGYWLHRGIEYISEHWGARRLVFGSNWPRLGHGITLAPVTTAEISDEDKRLIAGDNLRRLIAWAKPVHPTVALPPPADEYVAYGRSGQRPADMLFHDNHGHLGGRACHYHLPNASIDGIVRDMDRLGVEKTCAFCFTGVFSDETYGNDLVMDAVRRHPERFVGFTMLNPLRGEADMLRELERGQAGGLRGVKLIPSYQGYPEEGPLIDVACRWAHEHRQIILNHYWGGAPQMERLVRTYPNACFFTGHTTLEYADVMKRHSNLYVCTCPLLEPRTTEQFVAAIGADRLMYGSDLQDLPIAWGYGPVLFARITPAEKKLIMGDNLRRVLMSYSLR